MSSLQLPEMSANQSLNASPKSVSPQRFRRLIAGGVCLLTASYLFGTLSSILKPEARLKPTELWLVVVAIGIVFAVLNPEWIEALSSIKIGEFEVQLRELKEKQAANREQIEDFRFVWSCWFQAKRANISKTYSTPRPRDMLAAIPFEPSFGSLDLSG